MHRGKGMKFVGDSRVPSMEFRKPNVPKDYSEYPGKTEAFWPIIHSFKRKFGQKASVLPGYSE